MECLSDKDNIVVEGSASTFTFADGVTVHSLKRVSLPCKIGGIQVKLATDVVECNIPLLMSHRSMKRGRMIINFGSDQVRIGDKTIDLGVSRSGHYLLPLAA